MNQSLFSTLIALVLLSPGVHAQEVLLPPTIPAPGLDSKLLNNQTPQAFFAARKTNTACRSELTTRKATYFSQKDALAKLAGSTDLDALDAQGLAMEGARDAWVEKMRECGNCTSQDIEVRPISTAGRTEFWYIGDGSCYVEGLNANGNDASFNAKADSLVTPDMYRHYTGGFPTVLDFYPVDPKTGQKMADPKIAVGTPFNSFISIRGPVLLGLQASFGYYYKNDTKFRETNGVKEYIHTFEAEKAPRAFRFPSTVAQHMASGRTRDTNMLKLTRVQGMWYLTNDGYLRYYTAADLGMNLDFAKRLAQNIMLTTLATLYERGVGEAP